MLQNLYSWARVDKRILSLLSNSMPDRIKTEFLESAIQTAMDSNNYPSVGTVIVKDGEIVSKGHRNLEIDESDHTNVQVVYAETMALEEAGVNSRGADLYTTLEPSTTFGRASSYRNSQTAVDAISNAGIKRVIVGLVDRHPFSGMGIEKLVRNGIQVEASPIYMEPKLLYLVGDGNFLLIPTSISESNVDKLSKL